MLKQSTYSLIAITFMITCQLTMGLGTLATGAHAGTSSHTLEGDFIANLYSEQGLGLSQDELAKQTASLVETYTAQSAAESEAERETNLSQALVDMGVYTRKQADSFVADAATISISANSTSSEKELFASQIQTLLSSYPQGAQFSACDHRLIDGEATLGIAAFVLASAGVENPVNSQAKTVSTDVGFGVIAAVVAAITTEVIACRK